jgi:hypothetical protein
MKRLYQIAYIGDLNQLLCGTSFQSSLPNIGVDTRKSLAAGF